jgi:hypothetical protein
MKYLITTVAAASLAMAFAVSADAAGMKKKETTGMSSHASANKAATCKAEAKKKFSAIHILKRRAFEKKCMGTA